MILRSTAELCEICAISQSAEYITVDTEFIRKKGAFYPEPSLIQLSIDGKVGYICDVLDKTIDLEPLRILFANPAIVKVFHSCKQDLHVIYKVFGIIPSNIFDVQIASMFLGYYQNPSYNLLVQDFLGVQLDKELQFSRWLLRPLLKKQIEYAERDVTYLFKLFPVIREKLGEKKYRWAQEEIDNILKYDLEATVKDKLERAALKTLNRNKTVNPRYLWLLNIALRWREEYSLECNIVRHKIINGLELSEFIYRVDKYFDELDRSRLATNKTTRHIMTRVELALNQGMDLESSHALMECTLKKRDILHTDSKIYEDLKETLKECSYNSSMNKNFICDKADILNIAAANALTAKFDSGWRYEVFGNKAKELLKI
jgi:ribonuclease D